MCVVGGEVLFGGGLCFIQVEIVKLHKTPRRSSVRFYVFVKFNRKVQVLRGIPVLTPVYSVGKRRFRKASMLNLPLCAELVVVL